MKTTLKFVAILLTACAGAHAQVVPEATGPRGLPVSSNLHYTLRYSQTAEFGGGLGNWQTANPSASVDYENRNTRLPFALNYAGGYTATLSGPSYGTGFFQHLFISQGISGRRWNVLASDDVSYTPESPTTGFSGIPGTGEPIAGSGPNPSSSQSILALNTHAVSNVASGEFGYHLNYATTLNLGGSSNLLRYPDGNGLDTDGLQANAGLTRRLNARNSLSGQYIFSRYSYSSLSFNSDINTALFGYQRTWSPKLTTNVSVGPQWIGSSNSAFEPPSRTIAANAGINYQARSDSASLSYNRGASNGGGYLTVATVDSVTASFSRDFERDLTIGITGSYARTAGLQIDDSGVTDARYGGVQATRRLGRYLNVFANYTTIDQSSSLALSQPNVLNQLYQVIGFGVAYSSRDRRLRQ